MTPADKVISVGPGVSHETAKALLYEHRLEKLPVLDERGKVVGLITAADVAKAQQYPYATCDVLAGCGWAPPSASRPASSNGLPCCWTPAPICWCWISRTGTPITVSSW